MIALKRLVPAASLASFILLSACGDSTSPTAVDPVAMQSSFSASMTTFQSNPAFQSISILADQLPPLAAAGVMPLLLSRPGAPALQASRLASFNRLLHASVSGVQALFPANVLGKTMVWDTATSQYVIGAQTGAPANGMRLILYFADPATGLPFKPLQVLGYIELTDKSTPQADKLGIVLTLVTTTVASYDITVISNTNSASARAAGYFLDGTAANRVDFDFNQAATSAGTLTSTNDLTAADGSHVRVTLTANLVSGAASIATLVQRDHAGLEIDVGGDLSLQTISGAVKYNGGTVGTISGTGDAPVITGAGGRTFTAGETAALLAVFTGTLDLIATVANGVFAPGNMVFHAALP